MTRAVICVLVSAAGTAAMSCTGFYVGRKVSADGTTCLRKGEPVILDETAPYLNDFRARMQAKWPDRKIG